MLRVDVAELRRLGGPAGAAARVRSLVADGASVAARVGEILASVRAGGDDAVLEHTRRLDTGGREPAPLLVAADELDEAIKTLPLELVAGLQVAIANVARVAEAGVRADPRVELPQGQRITVREIPVAAAAVYVPGGRAPYPSTVVMGVVTARAAGVIDVSVCSPPGPDGQIHPAILGTCRLCGVERVYRMGGAQAIAALAYGTESIERVDKIVGPGNAFVTLAKHEVFGAVGIDQLAGPSEIVVIATDGADPELVAADLVSQLEHDPLAWAVCLTDDAALAEAIAAAFVDVAEDAARRAIIGMAAGRHAGVVRCGSLDEMVTLAAAFAPEHLSLQGRAAETLRGSVRNAGAVFVGSMSPVSIGDYVAGPN
ncbi:MAG TPA: histidinol dehydrogenase, partial [Solirubrobacteraceae bacterium]